MKSLVQLQTEIKTLQQQAADLRTREYARTVKDIVQQMAAFGITFADLKAAMQRAENAARGKRGAKAGRPRSKAVAKAGAKGKPAKVAKEAGKGRTKPAKAKTRKPAAIKYRGPGGEAWSGRGKTPTWLRAQLEAGKSVEDFRV